MPLVWTRSITGLMAATKDSWGVLEHPKPPTFRGGRQGNLRPEAALNPKPSSPQRAQDRLFKDYVLDHVGTLNMI